MTGTLYGVGVGPGDPDLLTLKAHRLITGAKVIAYPAPDTGDSFARAIVADLMPQSAREIAIIVPMTGARFPAQDVYDRAAADVSDCLDAGDDVIVLCEGDPFFYGSFMYLYQRLADTYEVEIVPGITSMTACAAVLSRPLAARNDVISIVPAPLPEDELKTRIDEADAVAIIKVGRHLAKVRAVLDDLGLTARAGYVERATLANQKVGRLVDVAPETAPYFSMILVYKGSDPWIA